MEYQVKLICQNKKGTSTYKKFLTFTTFNELKEKIHEVCDSETPFDVWSIKLEPHRWVPTEQDAFQLRQLEETIFDIIS